MLRPLHRTPRWVATAACVRSFVAESLGEPSSGRILTEAAASGARELLPVRVAKHSIGDRRFMLAVVSACTDRVTAPLPQQSRSDMQEPHFAIMHTCLGM